MTTHKTDYVKGVKASPEVNNAAVVAIRAQFDLTAALASGDVVQFVELPAGRVVHDFQIDNDDLDSGATVTADVGILNDAGTAISTDTADGGKWITNGTELRGVSVVGLADQAAAVRAAVARMEASDEARIVAVVLTAGPTTATSGKIGFTLTHRTP